MDDTSQPQTMMALRAHQRGGAETLVYESAPKPSPAPGHVLIAVDAASITFTELNWDETWTRDGQSRLPIIPSHEFAGEVSEIGPGVTDWEVGDQVFGLIPFDLDGAAAEFVSLEASILARSPLGVAASEVAATPLAGLTAWQGLVDHGKLEHGQRVLIHGGAGGVGIFAVQLAHHFGAEVTVTARAADRDFLLALGADHVVDFETDAFDELGRVFDIVLDPIGGETLERSFAVVRPGGTLITLNAPPSQERAVAYDITALFFIVDPSRSQLAQIADLMHAGELRSIVAATFPLSEGRRAFESGLEHRRPPGKTVLVVR